MNTPAILSILLGGYISLANWIFLYQAIRDRNKDIDSHPTPPLVGAFFLGLGLYCFEITRPYFLFSIVADWGTLFLVISLPKLIYMFCKHGRFWSDDYKTPPKDR